MNSTRNNFDLLRLFAAFQVLFFHASAHLGIAEDTFGVFSPVFGYFEGVPIFFVISGYLISMSYERCASAPVYFQNRFLRIYPALWVCFLVSLAILAVFGQLDSGFLGTRDFVIWIIGQLSIVQYFNPDQLRDFGVGVINGSLWTIPVELEFYLLLPALYAGMRRLARRGAAVLAGAGFLASFALYYMLMRPPQTSGVVGKMLLVSVAPHLFMFALGIACQRYFAVVSGWVTGKWAIWTLVYIGFRAGVDQTLGVSVYTHPALLLISKSLLAIWVLSVAYSGVSLSHRLLRGTDISYGVYIYHMPVVNVLVALQLTGSPWQLGVCTLSTFALGLISWHLIERPALRLKRRSLRPV